MNVFGKLIFFKSVYVRCELWWTANVFFAFDVLGAKGGTPTCLCCFGGVTKVTVLLLLGSSPQHHKLGWMIVAIIDFSQRGV